MFACNFFMYEFFDFILHRGGLNSDCDSGFAGPLCSGCASNKNKNFYEFGQFFCLECPEIYLTIIYTTGYSLGLIIFILVVIR